MSTSDLICRVSPWGGDVVSHIGFYSVSSWLARMGYRVMQSWWAVRVVEETTDITTNTDQEVNMGARVVELVVIILTDPVDSSAADGRLVSEMFSTAVFWEMVLKIFNSRII